jgi:effector-binding domain-containing protein
MLAMKQAEIEQQIEHERARLARVEARLRQIEHEGEAGPYDVVLKRVDAVTIAGVRQIVPHVSMMPDLRFPALRRLYDWLGALRLPRAEPELMLYHNPEYSDEDIDMEAAVALDKPALKALSAADAAEHGVSVRQLPPIERMASAVHHGRLVDIPMAIIAIFTWMGRNGYRSAGPIREIHLFGREIDIADDPADWGAPRVMEIQVPVEPE